MRLIVEVVFIVSPWKNVCPVGTTNLPPALRPPRPGNCSFPPLPLKSRPLLMLLTEDILLSGGLNQQVRGTLYEAKYRCNLDVLAVPSA